MHLKAAAVEKSTGAARTLMRPLSSVEALVELEMDELCEASGAELALIRPLTRV